MEIKWILWGVGMALMWAGGMSKPPTIGAVSIGLWCLIIGCIIRAFEKGKPYIQEYQQVEAAKKARAGVVDGPVVNDFGPNATNEDAFKALVAMGIKKVDALKAIQLAQATLGNNTDTNAIIVEALRSKK